jgi:DNA-directed RNA polymerase specialized sigma24 family protein
MTELDARKLLAHARRLSARYARRLGPDEAADLVGEAVTRGLERPPADGNLEPWIERIARNLGVDLWRRAEVARLAEPEAGDRPLTPEELLLARERRRAVRRSLLELRPEQRRSVLRRFYLERGGAGAGLSATTARTRLHRGLTALRALTRRLLALPPPWRLFQWITLAANPAVVAVALLAQQTPAPLPPAPAVAAPAAAHARPAPRHFAAEPAPPVPPSPPPAARASSPHRAPAPPAPPAPPPRRYDFDDDQIAGVLESPDGDHLTSPPRVRHSSLIEIPDSFVVAIARSLEDL